MLDCPMMIKKIAHRSSVIARSIDTYRKNPRTLDAIQEFALRHKQTEKGGPSIPSLPAARASAPPRTSLKRNDGNNIFMASPCLKREIEKPPVSIACRAPSND
jgi:hypothetical protein